MRNAIFTDVGDVDLATVTEAVEATVEDVATYVPGTASPRSRCSATGSSPSCSR